MKRLSQDTNVREYVPYHIIEMEVPYPTLAEGGVNEEVDIHYMQEFGRVANEE